MPEDVKTIHKIKFMTGSAETYCGKEIMAYYPPSGYCTSTEAGQLQFRGTTFDKNVTCEKCKEKLND